MFLRQMGIKKCKTGSSPLGAHGLAKEPRLTHKNMADGGWACMLMVALCFRELRDFEEQD